MKLGILLAAFGSSSEKALRTLEGFGDQARRVFPGASVRWAFTSGVIRDRLAEEGKKTDSVRKALEKMWFEKFRQVAVQSLHVIPGAEFDALADAAGAMQGPKGFERVVVGAPLLGHDADYARVAQAVLEHLPPERGPGEGVVLMGHGTRHEAQDRYAALAGLLRGRDPHIHIGTMADPASLDQIIADLRSGGARRVWLMPLLAVAGGHVLRDMAGDEPDSWRSRLQAAGLACLPVLRGTAEYRGFADVWIDHLRRAVDSLQG